MVLNQLSSLARRQWFYLLLPVLLLASWGMSASADWRLEARASEAALLFDWCLFVPFLYGLYLRPLLPVRAVLLRTLAMACAGLWFAQLLAPDTAESMLVAVAPLRWIGLAILASCEAVMLAALLRLAFTERPDMAAIGRHGLPSVVARLMVLEDLVTPARTLNSVVGNSVEPVGRPRDYPLHVCWSGQSRTNQGGARNQG